jgi:hypothetical protein
MKDKAEKWNDNAISRTSMRRGSEQLEFNFDMKE